MLVHMPNVFIGSIGVWAKSSDPFASIASLSRAAVRSACAACGLEEGAVGPDRGDAPVPAVFRFRSHWDEQID